MGRLFEILNAGGIFMYAILATSIFSVGLILHRVYSLWIRYRLDTKGFLAELAALVTAGEYSRALQLCSGTHPLQEMVRAALMRANRSEKEIRRAVETQAVTALAQFRKGTGSLPQLSNLATLLGLLGTIHGLIVSFSGMQGADASTRQAALSKGVAIAFYNTFFGLTVATVTVVAYLFVSARQGKSMTEMEHVVSSLLDQILSSTQRSQPGAPSSRMAREA